MTYFKSCWRQKNVVDLCSTIKPIATNGRREDYVRLPFVDDLCLHSAMQDFLRRKPSSQAKLTGRQIRSSLCQRCHNQSILPCYLITEGLSITSEVFTRMSFRGTHSKVWWAFTCVSPKYSALQHSRDYFAGFLKLGYWLVRAPPTMKLRRRLDSTTSYAYDL